MPTSNGWLLTLVDIYWLAQLVDYSLPISRANGPEMQIHPGALTIVRYTRLSFNFVSTYFLKDADMNFQMFYWAAEVTHMNVTQSLWDFLEVSKDLNTRLFHPISNSKWVENMGSKRRIYRPGSVQHQSWLGWA